MKTTKTKTIELEYDLTQLDVDKLGALFHKYGISDSAYLLVSRDVLAKGLIQVPKISEELPLNSLGLRAAAWCFESYDNEFGTTKIIMRANPFANGLLANTTQGTRGYGYCSYISVITDNKNFAREFKKLVREGECKEIFSESV